MYLKYYSGYHYGTTNIDPENPEEYDYFTFVVPASQGKGRKIEYFLTLDIAKEIAMLSRSAMGKEVRRYFINAEKTLVKVQHVLTSNDKTTEEKLAEALLLSQEIISRTNKDIVRANKNKQYNKKVNVRLRREIRELKKNNVSSELIAQKDKEIEFLEGNVERLEDQNIQLKARINRMISAKIDGKSILNALAVIDVQRRQRFAINKYGKDKASVKAYVFRKEAILDSGIILNNEPGKSLVDNINVKDMGTAVYSYVEALRKLINNEELFEELFGYQYEKAKDFLAQIEFNAREEEDSIAQ